MNPYMAAPGFRRAGFRRNVVWIAVLLLAAGLTTRTPAYRPLQAQADATPAVTDTVVCPALPAIEFSAGLTDHTLEFDGLARGYELYIPASYDGSQPVPLVLSLHGFASNPAQQAGYSRWNDIADRENLIIVYPQGTGFPARWYSGVGIISRERAADVDDVGFIRALLGELTGSLCIDPARIYVNGLSNGGGMTDTLACQLADQIAAIGTVAGAYTEPLTTCDPARPIPVIAFHGKLDPIVPYEGTEALKGFQQWGADWAARNGCDATPETFTVTDQVSGQRYLNCTDDAEVLLYTIADGGHTWPGEGDPIPEFVAGKTSTDIDASETMWTFFMAHPLLSDRG